VKALAVAVIAGALFALGLVVAGMTDPEKVTGFLDVGGAWDPTLAFVMAGAIALYAPIARLVRARHAPLYGDRFHWPTAHAIDPRLVGGAALFGVGWGLSGYCPGPALVGIAAGAPATVVFVASMLAGMLVVRMMRRR
jgi:uncharacterized membrane protein YedE/YeeE